MQIGKFPSPSPLLKPIIAIRYDGGGLTVLADRDEPKIYLPSVHRRSTNLMFYNTKNRFYQVIMYRCNAFKRYIPQNTDNVHKYDILCRYTIVTAIRIRLILEWLGTRIIRSATGTIPILYFIEMVIIITICNLLLYVQYIRNN